MKITTWNINGIRAGIKKGAFSWMQLEDIDVFYLQEVKARQEQLPEDAREITNYTSYWNPAARPGYSGVAIYTRVMPQDIYLGLGDDRFDDEGRVIRLKFPGFMLFNIYFPNGQRGQGRVNYKLDFYAALLEQCDRLLATGQEVIITGDFNTAHREIDLAHPKSNIFTSGFLAEERALIDRYLEHGFVDIFRQLYPDRVQYTWWSVISNARTRNVGWRLDYYLISQGLVNRVEDVIVHDMVLGSDHCPVSLLLNV